MAGMVLFTVACRYFGERWWPLSVLLYFPAQVWLLPLPVLGLAGWLWARRWLALLAVTLGFWAFGFAGLRLGAAARAPETGRSVTVLTNNVGQSNHLSMAGFVKATKPDLLVVQDARGRASAYRREYPGWNVASAGEFVVISRFPISSARLLDKPARRRGVGALFRVEWPGRPFHLYAVHLPTPRRDFEQLRGRGFLAEWVVNAGPPWKRYAKYKAAMAERVALVRELAGVLGDDPEPVLVAGDFNMPSWGFLHSVVDSRLTDAFAVSGRGFGFTFPGFTRNPLTFFGPWLQLDYLFCNAAWTPVACSVESRRASQHRAVAATFEWNEH